MLPISVQPGKLIRIPGQNNGKKGKNQPIKFAWAGKNAFFIKRHRNVYKIPVNPFVQALAKRGILRYNFTNRTFLVEILNPLKREVLQKFFCAYSSILVEALLG